MTLEEALAFMEATKDIKPKPTPPKRYKATAYVERCLRQIVGGIDNNNWDLIANFIDENLTLGFTVVVTDNVTHESKTLYPEYIAEYMNR